MTIQLSAIAPRWFRAALEQRPEHREVEVHGASINLRCWGRSDAPGLVLVHGGSAHSGWWDHIAPLLASSHRIVALDLSGHGDSEARSRYPMSGWASEVVAAASAGGISGRPIVIGHSMGGWVAAATGAIHGDDVAGIVIIDSPLFDEPPEDDINWQLNRKPRAYPSKEEICSRFRTEPEQGSVIPYVLRHVASESVRQTADGWVWKFDPEMFRKRRDGGEHVSMRGLLDQVRTPTVFVRCEEGLVSPDMAREISAILGVKPTIVELAAAGHHPMMDQPLALVATLRTVLAMRINVVG